MLKYFSSLFLFASLLSFGEAITCISKGPNLRQFGLRYPVDAKLFFDRHFSEDGSVRLRNIVGHIAANFADAEGSGIQSDVGNSPYYGIFRFGDIVNNPNYNPHVYGGYIRFRNFDALNTNNHDGGGMFGEFVLQKDPLTSESQTIKAVYIFQAGDHMGGSIDFVCQNY